MTFASGDVVECRKHRFKHAMTSECYGCLVDERDRLRDINQHFNNLLAIIHRDDGYYMSKYGIDKAVKDAKVILGRLMSLEDDHK